jgi:hypothetical protein
MKINMKSISEVIRKVPFRNLLDIGNIYNLQALIIAKNNKH